MKNHRKMFLCAQCGKPFAAVSLDGRGYAARSFDVARIDPEGFFCTLRCAARFGHYAAKTVLNLTPEEMPPSNRPSRE